MRDEPVKDERELLAWCEDRQRELLHKLNPRELLRLVDEDAWLEPARIVQRAALYLFDLRDRGLFVEILKPGQPTDRKAIELLGTVAVWCRERIGKSQSGLSHTQDEDESSP